MIRIVGLDVSEEQPGNWQESLEDIMGKSAEIKRKTDSSDHLQYQVKYIESLIEDIERRLQDVQEFVESMARYATDDQTLQKFELYAKTLTIASGILSDWATLLNRVTEAQDAQVRIAFEMYRHVRSYKNRFWKLNSYLRVLLGGDLDGARNFVTTYFGDYYNRLERIENTWKLGSTTELIFVDDQKEGDQKIDSKKNEVHQESEANGRNQELTSNLRGLILSNLRSHEGVDGNEYFTIDIKFRIEGALSIGSTSRKSPDAFKVGYFLHTFSSALKEIDGVQVSITDVSYGSVNITLNVVIPNLDSANQVVDLLEIVGSHQSLNYVQNDSNEVVNATPNAASADLSVDNELLKLMAQNASAEDFKRITQLFIDNMKLKNDLLQIEKTKRLIETLKPAIEIQDKITMELENTKVILNCIDKEDADTKKFFQGI